MNKYQNIKAIAFDFWGVFAVINPPMDKFLEEHNVSLEQYSKQIHDLIVLHDLNKIDEKEFLKKCSELVEVEIPYEECRYVHREGTLNAPLIDIIKKLKTKYKIALLTNNNKEYTEEYIRKPGLDKLFDVEVISYEVGYRKPDPETYQILIRRLGVEPDEILFLDDEPNKLGAAETQGIQTLVYKWGETDKILEYLL